MPYQIIKGNLADQRVDVIVNPTDSSLSLRRLRGRQLHSALWEVTRYEIVNR